MTFPVRAEPFVTQMHRGQLPAVSCRHVGVDGPERQSGGKASPGGITPSTVCDRAVPDRATRTVWSLSVTWSMMR